MRSPGPPSYLRPPLPQDLPPPPLLPRCGEGIEQIGSANLRREFPEMKVFSPKI